MDDNLNLNDVLTEKAGEAAKYAVMRSMPAFLNDLTDGGTRTCVENTMVLRVKVRHEGGDSFAQALDVSWLPRARVKEKDFPEFRAGEDRQLEMDFDQAEGKESDAVVKQAEEDPGTPDEWKPLLDVARKHGLAIYCPCRHGKAHHMDTWRDGTWQSCRQIAESQRERVRKECAKNGIVLGVQSKTAFVIRESIVMLLELGETVAAVDWGKIYVKLDKDSCGMHKVDNMPANAIPDTYPWPFAMEDKE